MTVPPRKEGTLAKLAALEAARSSFDGAHAAIVRRCGPVIGKRQVEESVTGAAADIHAFYAARVPQPCTQGTLVILSADCRPHDVIVPPCGRHGTRTPRPGPRARARWLAGSVRKDPAEVIQERTVLSPSATPYCSCRGARGISQFIAQGILEWCPKEIPSG